MLNKLQFNESFTGKVLVVAGVLAAFVILLYLLLKIAHILLVLFMGILLAVILDTLMGIAVRLVPMPRSVAFIIVLIVLLGLILILGLLIGPHLIDRLTLLSELIPQAYDNMKSAIMKSEWAAPIMNDISRTGQLLPPLSAILGGISGIFSTVFGTVISIFIIVFMGIYLAFQPDYYIKKIMKILPIASREKAEQVIYMAGRALRWWFFGQLLSMLIVGIFMAIGLAIAGIPFPITLGLVAALLCFVPYIGPILASIPPVLVAMTVGTDKVIYAFIVYLIVQTSESYIVTPLIQKRAVFIPPAFLFTAQVIMGVIAGAIGVVLATPLAVVIIVFIQKLYIHDILGDTVVMLGDHKESQ